MPQTQTEYLPLPPDDLNRSLTFANPDQEEKLPHIGLVGDTYTITVDGNDSNGRFCVVDMHIPPGGGPGPHRHDSSRKNFSCPAGEQMQVRRAGLADALWN